MKLEHFFDAAFVINLKKRTDRLFDFMSDAESNWGVPMLFGWLNRFRGYEHPTSGNHGCSNSHRALIRQIAESDYERVLIVEDDCTVLTPEALTASGFGPNQESPVWDTFHKVPGKTLSERFDFLSPHIPEDWDVIYLGGGYGEPPMSRMNEFCLRVGFMQTTSSYGITREFARKWTEDADKRWGSLDNYPGPADNMLCAIARENKYYCLQPRLCYQRESLSDITGQSVSYLNSMTDPTAENLL